ncbi:unnamed protein product [Adineta steineri]|uniref:ABC transmembrane type-1 domain-containing protein n=1 Tax=Adineta steineri TaxID=433720 RepID=A0A820GC94_9BILA|nr:unnamed protein product [Adineta steineri]
MFYFAHKVLDNLILIDSDNIATTSSSRSTANSAGCQNTYTTSEEDIASSYSTLQSINIKFVVVGCISIFLYWVAWASWMTAAERQIRRIRYKLFRNILSQEIGWFDIHSTGELNNRLTDDLGRIFSSEKVPDFVTLLAKATGVIVYALVVGWKLALVFLSVSPLVILMYRITIVVIVKYSAKEIEAYGLASSIAEEALRNIRTVTSFHGQKKEEEQYRQNLFSAKKVGIRKSLYIGLCQGFGQLFSFSAITLTFWYGLKLVKSECQNYTPGTLIIIFITCMNATTTATQFIPFFQTFAEASTSGSYVFEMIERVN